MPLHSLRNLISSFLARSLLKSFILETSFENIHNSGLGLGKGAGVLRSSNCGSDAQQNLKTSTLEDRNVCTGNSGQAI